MRGTDDGDAVEGPEESVVLRSLQEEKTGGIWPSCVLELKVLTDTAV
jgi:hypothetical protein